MIYEEWHDDWERKQAELKVRREKQKASILAVVGQNGENIDDETRKWWFYNYGCCNGWTDITADKFAIACVIHNLDCKNHPELHKPVACRDNKPILGYHHDKCSCGFEHSCDSSD